jgi:endonuclease-3 related protein
MVGAILTQNTAWSNVEKAISNFNGNLSPEYIENINTSDLIKIIYPSGFHNQKAVYLKEFTKWYKKYDYSIKNVQQHDLNALRKELLAIRGVGYETADSILLYAFDYPTFVVDAYTKRLLERLGIDVALYYHSIKTYFENELDKNAALYNNYHALIVINGKEHCRKKPICTGCPLIDECRYK